VSLDHDQFITKNGLEIDLFSFRSRVEDVVKSMSVSFFALILSLQNFDFYISQEATYTKDIIEEFKKKTSTKLPVVTDEMRLLLNDHYKISTSFPKIFDLGMLTVDATDYFDKVKEKIMLYINQFKTCK
jgi:hypothetical protein